MSEPNPSSSIDLEQAVVLVSRAFSAFLLFWVVDDITELPRELFSVMHYLRESTQAGMGIFQALHSSYLVSLYMMYLLANILRIALWLLAAGWFYRCGGCIRGFFTARAERTRLQARRYRHGGCVGRRVESDKWPRQPWEA
jgi:hypothetical protein